MDVIGGIFIAILIVVIFLFQDEIGAIIAAIVGVII